MATLNNRCRAGSRSTVKARSRPVNGSLSPNGSASRAGNQRLQPRAIAVAEAARAAARASRRLFRGQINSGPTRARATPATNRGDQVEVPANPANPVITSSRKGEVIKPLAWMSR